MLDAPLNANQPAATPNVQQIIYALQRAAQDLQAQADRLGRAGDYSAEFPAEDAERMREAEALLLPLADPSGQAWSLNMALQAMTLRKDDAYLERNRCVALIARMALAMGLNAGLARTAIEGWSDDWHGCVYVELPTGQTSWHFHDSQAHLFAGLPPYIGSWDGHDTPEKYRRVAAAFVPRADGKPTPELACARCSFMLAATREAQAFAGHYGDKVMELRGALERECTDTDALLRGLGLDPARCRTEGGSLQVRKALGMLAGAPNGEQR
jgi:hypothetical protein